jgi:hypothetical protein
MTIPGRPRLGVAARLVAGVAAAGSAASACVGSAEPPVMISAVTPSSGYNNFKVSIVIEGGPFRPIYDVDTSGASETTELGAFTAFLSPSGGGITVPADDLMWLSQGQLAADLPPSIAPGPYDVEVRDPRGGLARKQMGFVSLGPDRAAPTVKIDEPEAGAIVNEGAEVPVAFEADDGVGVLDMLLWKVSSSDVTYSGSCSHAPAVGRATCRFLFTAPPPSMPGQPLNVLVTATDAAGNVGKAQTTLSIGVAPTVSAFEPFKGPAVGGTPISVHGKNFIPGTQVLVGGALIDPGGGTVVSDTLIQGTTPAHDPGPVVLTVRTGGTSVDAPGSFTFVGRPEVLAVSPASGPLAGCTPVTIVGKFFDAGAKTRFWFGSDLASASALQCTNYVSPNRVEGLTPPGAGAVSVFAEDPVSGVGELPLAYTYLDVDTPDGGSAAPASCPCDGGTP